MVAALAISAAATVASSIQAANAAKKQAALAGQQATVATQVADYNAKVDQANAEQLAMDAHANIERQRADNATYLSSQRAAYAASGILSGTGSPLAVQATTAGRMEEDVQNYWRRTQQQENNLYGAAQMERFGGEQQARAYREEAAQFRAQGMSAIFQGIGGVAKIGGQIATNVNVNNTAAAMNNPYGTSTFRPYKPWAGWDVPSAAIGRLA